MIDIKERLRNMQLTVCKEAADHIATLEASVAANQKAIKELHSSLAGAVQHGIEGWNRYESANRMCMNQQNEIAGLNQG